MKYKLLLLLIILFGFGLRIWRITAVPPGLSNDEIAIAYEAYSIANTGRDSLGRSLPVSFKVNEDRRAPLYVYLTAPFVQILGNKEISVRLPSVIIGTLTIIGLYLLVKKLGFGELGSLAAAFLLAITPWHVYISRIGFETNLALLFVVFGAYFFLKGVDKRKYLFVSSVFFALSLYSYYTEWVFTPLLLISLTAVYFRRISRKKDILIYWFIFLLLILPILIDAFFFKGVVRANNEMLLNDFLLGNKIAGVGNIISKGFIIFSFWFDKYLRYIGFDYLFGHGLPVASPHGSSDFGLLNIVQFPLFLLGVYYAVGLKNKNTKMVLLAWSLLGPLVPSLTEGELNLGRNLQTLIPLTIVSALGLAWIWEKTKNKIVFAVCLLAILTNFAFFYRHYLTYFPIYYSENWSYGFKQIALYAKEHEAEYKKIVIDYHYGTTTDLYAAPSLFVLYFGKIDPAYYIKEKVVTDGGQFFGKYEFRRMDWPKEQIAPGSLYVVGVRSNPIKGQRVREIFSINLLNGDKAFKMYESY